MLNLFKDIRLMFKMESSRLIDRKKIKYTFTDVMIDIETCSTDNNAQILSIGIVKFNLFSEENNTETYTIYIDQSSCKDYHIDENTMKWWEKQPKSVYDDAFTQGPRVSMKEACEKLNEYCRFSTRYWCQGMNFDCVILTNAFKKEEVTPVWKYWQWRDSRTVQNMCKQNKVKNNHTALSDAINQVETVKFVFKTYNIQSA